MTQWLGGPGASEVEADPYLALFRSMDGCLATLRAWLDRDARRRAPVPDRTRRLVPATAAMEVAAMLDGMADHVVPERVAKQILARYGVPVVAEALVADPEAAVAASIERGFPVVLKIDSPDIPHKSDAGLVRLGLADAGAVRQAATDVLDAARALRPEPRVDGVLVQPMLPGGTEVLVGARVDPLFGPLILVGLGGLLVEMLHDTCLAPAPVQPDEALAMLRSLKGAKLLDGYRGMPAVDMGRLADVVARISELAADMADRVSEIDVNPLICRGGSVVAVDGLLVRATSGSIAGI